jgi:hypothetical protein
MSGGSSGDSGAAPTPQPPMIVVCRAPAVKRVPCRPASRESSSIRTA